MRDGASMIRKRDQVYDLVLGRFLGGGYRFGQRILVSELRQETGISRQPIMAALSTLSAEGFVRVVPQVGCEVVSPRKDDLGDFFLMFARMEGALAELAAGRGTMAQLRQLQLINREVEDLAPEMLLADEQYRLSNRALHKLIHQMAGAPMLTDQHSNSFAMADFFIAETTGFSGLIGGAAAEHGAILHAFRDRDASAARRAAEEHIMEIRDLVLQAG